MVCSAADLIWVSKLHRWYRWLWAGDLAISVNDIVGCVFAFVECQMKAARYPEANLPDFHLSREPKTKELPDQYGRGSSTVNTRDN